MREDALFFGAHEFGVEFKQNGWDDEMITALAEATLCAFPDFARSRVDLEVIQPKAPTKVHEMVFKMAKSGLEYLRIYPLDESGKSGPFEIVCEHGIARKHLANFEREAGTDEKPMTHLLLLQFGKMAMNTVATIRPDLVGRRLEVVRSPKSSA